MIEVNGTTYANSETGHEHEVIDGIVDCAECSAVADASAASNAAGGRHEPGWAPATNIGDYPEPEIAHEHHDAGGDIGHAHSGPRDHHHVNGELRPGPAIDAEAIAAPAEPQGEAPAEAAGDAELEASPKLNPDDPHVHPVPIGVDGDEVIWADSPEHTHTADDPAALGQLDEQAHVHTDVAEAAETAADAGGAQQAPADPNAPQAPAGGQEQGATT